MMRKLKAVLSLLLLSGAIIAQVNPQELFHQHHSGCSHGLIAVEEDANTYVPPPADFVPGGERSAIISVNYNGFNTQAQDAFQFAVDIWASLINSSVPILINANYTNLGGGVLGSAGATDYYRNFSGAPLSNTFYPAALASSLNGSDLTVGFVDITCNFNNSTNWYFGTDGNCPSGQFDFVTVVLHELCHGLGFIGSASVSGGTGFIGFSGSPVIYDRFVENGGGAAITSFPNNSTALGGQLTGNNLFWGGTFGVDANLGSRPRLYAPSNWNGGSSYSHLNEGTFPTGQVNSLMTPFLSQAEVIHNPGPIVLGMFEDMGWGLDNTDCAILNVSAGAQTPCDPATGTYSQEITVEYFDEPSTGSLVINGQNFSITGSPQTVSLSNLTANGNAVNVNVSFSDDPACTAGFTNLFTAPESCCTQLRIFQLDPDNQEFTLKNFGTCDIQTLNYIIRSGTSETAVFGTNIVSGSNFLTPGSEVTLEWPSWSPDPNGDDLALFRPNANTSQNTDLLDYVQWGDSNNANEALAVSAGIWGDDDFVFDNSPYDFIGGVDDFGVEFWDQIPPPCSISSIVAGTQGPCENNSYSQEVIVTYESEPVSGTLRVNNFSFPITGSPQTVVLNLPANGLTIDVNAFFSLNPSCELTATALFTAPEPCSNCEITSVVAGTQIPCFGNPSFYSQEVIVSYNNPPAGSSIIVNGNSFSQTGSPQSINLLGISDGLPVDVTVSFSLDSNCSLATPSLFIAPTPCVSCSIDAVTAGSQSACDPQDNTYSQELTINYSSAPSSGTLDVNGQSFTITSSPQTITLTGLDSDGSIVDVNVSFSDSPGCSSTATALFSAPSACDCPEDFNNDGAINIADLLFLLAETGCSGSCTADLNGDDTVNSADLTSFLGIFGSSCN